MFHKWAAWCHAFGLSSRLCELRMCRLYYAHAKSSLSMSKSHFLVKKVKEIVLANVHMLSRLRVLRSFIWTRAVYKIADIIERLTIKGLSITKTRLFKSIENNFQIKKSDIFHVSGRYIDCGYSLEPPWWGGSNEYLKSMFLSRNKKNNVYPCKPQFYYIKVGF